MELLQALFPLSPTNFCKSSSLASRDVREFASSLGFFTHFAAQNVKRRFQSNNTVLARFFKFTGARPRTQVHLRNHCDAAGSKNHANRRLQRRSSQAGRLHMRTRLNYSKSPPHTLASCADVLWLGTSRYVRSA